MIESGEGRKVHLIRPVFDSPLCDESQGPVDWFGTPLGVVEAMEQYQELGYTSGPFKFEIRPFDCRVRDPKDGFVIVILDRYDGMIWLWRSGTTMEEAKDLWCGPNPQKLPGELLGAKSVSGFEKVSSSLQSWPISERFVILHDDSCVFFQAMIIIHPSGDNEFLSG